MRNCPRRDASASPSLLTIVKPALKESGGFREYVREKCKEFKLVGSIQRVVRTDLEIIVEGVEASLVEFRRWLGLCKSQCFFVEFLAESVSPAYSLAYDDFRILHDARGGYTVADKEGILTGEFSGDEAKKALTDMKSGGTSSTGGGTVLKEAGKSAIGKSTDANKRCGGTSSAGGGIVLKEAGKSAIGKSLDANKRPPRK